MTYKHACTPLCAVLCWHSDAILHTETDRIETILWTELSNSLEVKNSSEGSGREERVTCPSVRLATRRCILRRRWRHWARTGTDPVSNARSATRHSRPDRTRNTKVSLHFCHSPCRGLGVCFGMENRVRVGRKVPASDDLANLGRSCSAIQDLVPAKILQRLPRFQTLGFYQNF